VFAVSFSNIIQNGRNYAAFSKNIGEQGTLGRGCVKTP
jgi:hypothetical protein